jgi:hypothetical protein
MTRPWLKDFPWESVVLINEALCQAKKALHKPTSEGYQPTKARWESKQAMSLTLEEAVGLCRECHRLAPFCFYNGNTFATIARTACEKISLPPLRPIFSAALLGILSPGRIRRKNGNNSGVSCKNWKNRRADLRIRLG